MTRRKQHYFTPFKVDLPLLEEEKIKHGSLSKAVAFLVHKALAK